MLSTFDTFIRLLKMGKRYWLSYIFLCLLTFLLSLISVATAEMLKRLANAAVDQNMALLMNTLIMAVGILVVQFMGGLSKKVLSERLTYRSTLDMQSIVLKKVLRAKTVELDDYHSGDVLNRIDDSIRHAQNGVNEKAQQVIENVLQIIFLLTYLTFINLTLTLGVLVIAVMLPIIINLTSKPLRNLYKSRQIAQAEKESFVQDVIQGGEVVRSYSLVGKMKHILAQKYTRYLHDHFKVQRYEVILFRSHTFIWLFGVLFVFGFGGYLVTQNQLDVGAVVAFAVSFERFAFPLSGLSGIWAQFQHALAHGSRIFELLDLSEEDEEVEGNEPAAIGDISFKSVSFSYRTHKDALKQVTLTLQAGTTTALVGPSGSGKSTIANLLLGLYEPSSGKILIGGKPLHKIHVSEWRGKIAYIPQDPVLFTGTIFENIAMGKEKATLDEVVAAAKSAQIHDFIQSNEQHYNSVIGENGLQLSGGEKQRLAIARAFLASPEIVILDEPTSALDTENESLIIKAFENLFYGRTVLIITHRLTTIENVDQIIVIEKGEIAESGTRMELIQRKGKFSEMYDSSQGEIVL